VHAEAISIRGEDGRTLRYICSILDITEHRALAERLQQQNAALAENARLREDVERMSRHDLKTPLNSIIGVARLLAEDASLQAEHRELLAITERAGYRMLEMVNLSLDLSRMELGTYDFRPQAVNVVDVVARVMLDLHGLAESSGVRVRLDQAFSRPVYARAEELLCYSILANLLKNAIEATPAGGIVRVGIVPGEPVQLRLRNPGRVPDAVAGCFFDKYVTAGKSGGTGLGTYSARLMARVQEGELDMATGDDGTVLTLSLRALGAEQLPVAGGRPASAPRGQPLPAGPALADFAPRRVLLVDDDEYNRLLLLRYLPSPPFTVDTAANGRAATEAFVRHWPDIVLIDLEMPVMDGPEAVAWIRERERQEGRPPCLVLMMSSNDDPESIRRGLTAGSNRYLAKPFTREALLATLQELDAGAAPPQVPLRPAPRPAPRAEDQPPAAPDAPVLVDVELLPEVPAFLESRRAMVRTMAEALAGGDRNQLRSVAHRAAGGLALFGFQWAAWQSRRISQRAAEGEAEMLEKEIGRLREHLQSVRVR
jgi:CheY-like chemotaxis protein/nitrogen-specific signal transduction histidine kinase